MLTESTIHQSMVWHVVHEQSPNSSFLSKRNSLRCLVSYRSRVRNTLSSAWKSVRRTWWWRCHGPCPIPRKLSKNMSTYARIFALGRRGYGSRVNLVCSAASGSAGGGATPSTWLSSL